MELTQIQATKGSTDLMNFTYDYGTSSTNTGRLLSRIDSIQPEHSANYTYDSIYRLSQVIAGDNSWGVMWTFDVFENWTAQTPQGLATSKVGTQTFGYVNNRNTSFTYDSAGNQTNDGNNGYTFNAENQITQVGGGGIATYAYYGEGRRMKKTVGSETTYTFYGPGGVLCEFSTTAGTGATQAASTDRTTYRTSERNSTAVLFINASGTVIENNRTLPYGESWLQDVESVNKKKFTTYDRDAETGLDYAMARYDSFLGGRFMSVDPYDKSAVSGEPRTLNRYLYVSDDPVNSTDPTGQCTIVGKVVDDGLPDCTDGTLTVTTAPPPSCEIGQALVLYPGGDLGCLAVDVAHAFDGYNVRIITEDNTGGGGGGGGATGPASNFTLGIRAPGESFNDCMKTNAGNYSLLGVADFALNANGQIADNFWLGFTPASNTVTTLYDAFTGSLSSLLQAGPMIAKTGMGNVVTAGRRTSSIMSLNLAGTPGGPKGGFPALGRAPSNAARAAKLATGVLKIAVDAGFFLSEGVGCAIPRKP